jgi:hypothetical protein
MRKLSWKDPIIRDGLTQDGYISEVHGLHGELRFSFRPMLPEQVEKWEAYADRNAIKNAEDCRARLGRILSQQVVTWSLVGPDGAPDDITEINCRRLRTVLQQKLYRIIACIDATEFPPDEDGGGAIEPLEVSDPSEPLGGPLEKLGK